MPVQLQCAICDRPFNVKRYRATAARFCSRYCKGRWQALNPTAPFRKGAKRPDLIGNQHARGHGPNCTSFRPGHRTWNKDLKGIHLSPGSEFQKGNRSRERAKLGEERIRVDKAGHARVWVKVRHPKHWELRARIVWAEHNGPIPPGKVIHHNDRDTLNDDPLNLQCLTPAEHLEEHRDEVRLGLVL